MDKYQYAVEQELKWLEDDIRITKDCINGKEPTEYPVSELKQRLRDSQNELTRLHILMNEYLEEHEN